MGSIAMRHIQATARSLISQLSATFARATRDAILYSVGANAAHGLRRTQEDKRRAVELLLRDDEWSKKSNRWIADACRVDHKTVSKLRAHWGIPQSNEVQGKDGRTTNVVSIGKNQPKAKVEPAIAPGAPKPDSDAEIKPKAPAEEGPRQIPPGVPMVVTGLDNQTRAVVGNFDLARLKIPVPFGLVVEMFLLFEERAERVRSLAKGVVDSHRDAGDLSDDLEDLDIEGDNLESVTQELRSFLHLWDTDDDAATVVSALMRVEDDAWAVAEAKALTSGVDNALAEEGPGCRAWSHIKHQLAPSKFPKLSGSI